MLDYVTDRVQDESRQGEAFNPLSTPLSPFAKRFYIESYGCQMNFADSEIVASILNKQGFGATANPADADLVFINTCSIREKAEQTIRKRLTEFGKLKKVKKGMLIGVLGCMAERLKSKLLEEERLVPHQPYPLPSGSHLRLGRMRLLVLYRPFAQTSQ